MGWAAALWSLGGYDIYVEPTGDTGWVGVSGDAEHHVLESDETTIHDVGRPSERRTWRGLVVGQADRDGLNSIEGTNVTYITPMVGDITGTCRVMRVSGKSVGDVTDPTRPIFHVTIELLRR